MNMKENWEGIHTLRDGEPCKHTGCLSHLSHPCEGCGRIGGVGNIQTRKHMEERAVLGGNYMNDLLKKYGRNKPCEKK